MARAFVASSSQSLNVASAPATAAPITMMAWVNATSITADMTVIGLDDGTLAEQFVLQVANGGAIAAQSVHASTPKFATTVATLSAGQFRHVCAVFASATSESVFLDGANKVSGSAASIIPVGIANARIARQGPSTNFFNGVIAECAIWNIALADAEVALLAAGVAPWLIHPEALKFYAPLLHGYSPEIELIGGRNLTLTNAPTIAAHPPIRYRSAA